MSGNWQATTGFQWISSPRLIRSRNCRVRICPLNVSSSDHCSWPHTTMHKSPSALSGMPGNIWKVVSAPAIQNGMDSVKVRAKQVKGDLFLWIFSRFMEIILENPARSRWLRNRIRDRELIVAVGWLPTPIVRLPTGEAGTAIRALAYSTSRPRRGPGGAPVFLPRPNRLAKKSEYDESHPNMSSISSGLAY